MILNLLLVVSVSAIASAQVHQKPMVISGFVRDFQGRVIDSANVVLQNRMFQPVAQTVTDKMGYYSLKVEKRDYNSLLAIRMSDYGKTRLEFWAWKIPPADSLLIDPRYHRLEVYGLNAFVVQGSGSRSIFVYFRPMSLTRYAEWQSLHDTTGSEMRVIGPTLATKDIAVTIDGQVSNILDLCEVKEKAKVGFMRGYFIQCTLPNSKPRDTTSRIVIAVTDPENQDKGEGMLFWSGD
jgi:hypothetical protein